MVVHKGLPALGLATAILHCLLSFFLGLLSPVHAAQNVALAWNAESGVASYRLHYGTASGNCTQTQNVGNTTTASVSSLTPCVTYFFVVTAFNFMGALGFRILVNPNRKTILLPSIWYGKAAPLTIRVK